MNWTLSIQRWVDGADHGKSRGGKSRGQSIYDPADAIPAPTTSRTYDLLGNAQSATDADGETAFWTYDRFGRVVTETYPDPDGSGPLLPPLTTYAYDAVGNMTSEALRLTLSE